jgi:hypothetical protein
MYRFVASNAERQPIVNVKSDVGKLCQRFDMMSVDVAFLAAILAGVTVALENSLAPFSEIAFVLAAPAMCCCAPLPYRGRIASLPVKQTLVRAKPGTSIEGVKLLAAGVAGFYEWLSAIAPAFLGAPFCICPVGFNFKRIAAHLARLGYAVSPAFRAMGRKAFNRAILLRLKLIICY